MVTQQKANGADFLTCRDGITIRSWNHTCATFFGVPSTSAVGFPLTSFFSDSSKAEYEAQRPELIRQGGEIHIQTLLEGHSQGARLRLSPQPDTAGIDKLCVATLTVAQEPDQASIENLCFKDVINALPGTFYVLREDGTCAIWNRALELVSAMSADEIAASNALDFFHANDKQRVAEKIREVFEHDAKVYIEANYINKFGIGTPYVMCGARIHCDGKNYLCGMGLDFTHQREQEEHLRLFERTLHATSNGIVITGCGGKDCLIEYVNPAFERITGYTAAQALGQDPRFMAAPGLDEEERERLRVAIREKREVTVVLRNRKKDGEIFWNELTITPVAGVNGSPDHFIGVLTDVTSAKQRTDRLEHEVNHDGLTGLANRTLLFDRLERAITLAQRSKTYVAVVLLDLNGFKQINDTFGHGAGDEVLRVVAERLKTSVREIDTVARLAGDEFVLVLVNQPSLRYTVRMINRLRAELQRPVLASGKALPVSASIGISIFPHDGHSAFDLVRHADVAMYHAKSTRSLEAHFYSLEMKQVTEAKQALEISLGTAIEKHEFFLEFLPKICAGSGRILGMEALLRWLHPEHGVLRPVAFLGEAEETGQILPIGRQVLDLVCEFLATLKKSGVNNIPVSINASHREVSQDRYVDEVLAVLTRHGLLPADLEIELKEENLLANRTLGITILSQMAECGLSGIIDCFGEGATDLGYLRRLPLRYIKLSRTAVGQISRPDEPRALAKTLIDVGHDMGIVVIAEGVETKEQADYLRTNGCEQLQGFFYGPPLSAGQAQLLASAGTLQ